MEMRISVVIATHRRADLLERTLRSLAEARRPAGFDRVVVVENGEPCGAEAACARLAERLPIDYSFQPDPGKGRSLQWAIERLRDGFALFLDDDVRVCDEILVRYAAAAERHGRQHFFGGPLSADREVEPDAWLKDHLPLSVTGWVPDDPRRPLRGNRRFLGANFGAFVPDLLAAGGFLARLGPGAFHAGTQGNPTGLDYELQDRLLRRGFVPVYVEGALVWHFVPRERCSESWILHRVYRQELSRAMRARGGRAGRVPLGVLLRWAPVAALAAFSKLVPDPGFRFRSAVRLQRVRGKIDGYRAREAAG
jgi:glycosyltransferase involved in cell wall biosynthesis